ncbi:MAG: isoprenylcysteine carboxylmethyltransferase family protein [Candidatus Bathyarchaeia archaeon]
MGALDRGRPRFVCLPLFLWVHHTLGKYFSPELELKEQHKLVSRGPYRWVRHPMYSVSFTLFIALSIVSANWLLSLLTVITIISVYARIGKEEAMMVERFGDEYRDYMTRTGRLLPRLFRKRTGSNTRSLS